MQVEAPMINERISRLVTGAGGALLIGSLFLPWAEVNGATVTGWELWTTADILLVLAAAAGIAVAITGGRFGLFRPDLSLRGAADLLSVASTLLIGWLILFDLPAGASAEPGAFLALLLAFGVACGAADWRVLRGAPAFPPVRD
jgi:hypothetical protein